MELIKNKIISINDFIRKTWIENKVLELTDTYKLKNPYDLCRALGISIKRIDCNSSILCNKASAYYRDHECDEVIFIRNDLYGYDEEDILRHELGHAILHKNIYNSTSSHAIKHECEANYFAKTLSEAKINIIRR